MSVEERSSRFRVISLTDAIERRAHISDQFARRRIEFRFFDAVDGRSLDIGKTPYRAHSGTRWLLTPSEVAVFESHRALWKMCVDRKWDHIVIFEDDILLCSDFLEAYQSLLSEIGPFDVVKLDWHPGRAQILHGRKLSSGHEIGRSTRTMSSAGCYMLSLRGARKLTAMAETYCDHADDFIFMPRVNWSPQQLYIPVAIQGCYVPAEDGDSRMSSIVSSGQRDQGMAEAPFSGPWHFRTMREAGKAIRKISIYIKHFGRYKTAFDGILPFNFEKLG